MSSCCGNVKSNKKLINLVLVRPPVFLADSLNSLVSPFSSYESLRSEEIATQKERKRK